VEVHGDFNPGSTFESGLLTETVDYWRALRGERRMPSHGDIDPLALPPRLLPHLSAKSRRRFSSLLSSMTSRGRRDRSDGIGKQQPAATIHAQKTP
jgi:hypothetical protein